MSHLRDMPCIQNVVKEIKDLIHDRICGIRLQNPQGAIFNIFSIYLPSRGSDEDYGSVLDDLYEIVISREMGSLSIIGGDANGDHSGSQAMSIRRHNQEKLPAEADGIPPLR